jgi:hypothetical protein
VLRPRLCDRSPASRANQRECRNETGSVSNYETSTGRETSARVRPVNCPQNHNRAPARNDNCRDRSRASSSRYRPAFDRGRTRGSRSGRKGQFARRPRQIHSSRGRSSDRPGSAELVASSPSFKCRQLVPDVGRLALVVCETIRPQRRKTSHSRCGLGPRPRSLHQAQNRVSKNWLFPLVSALRPRPAPVEASYGRAQAHPYCVAAKLHDRAQRNREPSAPPRTAFQSGAERHAGRV